jgi:hypothetical protein
MTAKYWFKIILGMLAIFTGGMFVVKGLQAGKNKVETLVDSAQPITVPLMGMAFRTAKGELGTLNKMRIERSTPREISGFHLNATLNEGVDVNQFDYCEVTVSDPEHLDENTSFDCLTAANPGFDDLVEFGSITFQPSGERHRLMVPTAVRDDIQSAFREDHENAGDSLAVDSADGGHLQVKINGKPIVDIRGDSAGGHVRVTDPATGQTIVDVKASDN